MMHYPVDVPPDYQTVMMVEEEDKELPSYDEAVVINCLRDGDIQDESDM